MLTGGRKCRILNVDMKGHRVCKGKKKIQSKLQKEAKKERKKERKE